ncbi:hypothetical protein BO71DRAFT_467507 [Aspergillus ellipticus CBS 707.79]|uniref:EthD domain-containing protein n=1 Tax=Aspergillus ellipticus CBS 707.79 TaxID=1448320 RepID=A0A319DC42_9EURO|nr:hypothetical protein BO71DRAFT_467507 [Aspergillus ellipticus CBS 707.79]
MPDPQYWLYTASHVRDPRVKDEAYSQWYQDHHVPDVMRAGSISKGSFYKNLSPTSGFRWLAAYDCADLDVLKPQNVAKIPKKHECLGTDRSCLEFAEFDIKQFQEMFELKNDRNVKKIPDCDRYLMTCSFHCDDGEELRRRCVGNDMLSVFPQSTWIKVWSPLEHHDTYLGYMIAQALDELPTENLLWMEDQWRLNLIRKLGLEGQMLQTQMWKLLKCHEV